MRFRLRTLLIVLAVGPPVLAWVIHVAVPTWQGLRLLIAFWPLLAVFYLPMVFFFVLPELGPLVGWLFREKSN